MKIYKFDGNTGALLSEENANLDPLEGKPLIPKNATSIKPTAPKDGFVKVFKKGKWSSVEDNRGMIYDTKNKLSIKNNALGKLPDGFTKKEPQEFDEWDGSGWSGHEENKKIWDGKEYQRQRALEYPSFGDQLDMLYWDKVNGTEKWKDFISKIKDKFPKA